MRNLLLISVGIFIHLYSFSQNGLTIKLIPNWEKGEIRKYEIKNYTTIKNAEGDTKIKSLTTKKIIVQILDVNENFFDINWITEQLIFSDPINFDIPFIGLLYTLDKGISVRYTINKGGEITSVANIEEIRKTINSRVDSVLKAFIENNAIDKPKAEMLYLQYSMVSSSDELLKTIVLTDVLKFHQLYGYSFTANQTTIIPDNIYAPNANGQPSNNLVLIFNNFDKKKICSIKGELKCAETDDKLRKFIDKDRIIKSIYEFQSPGNWLISHKSTTKVGGYGKYKNTYELNLIE